MPFIHQRLPMHLLRFKTLIGEFETFTNENIDKAKRDVCDALQSSNISNHSWWPQFLQSKSYIWDLGYLYIFSKYIIYVCFKTFKHLC